MPDRETLLLYVRRDAREAFATLRAAAAREGSTVNGLLCMAVRDLARYPRPGVEAARRLAGETPLLPKRPPPR